MVHGATAWSDDDRFTKKLNLIPSFSQKLQTNPASFFDFADGFNLNQNPQPVCDPGKGRLA
jgi:hypothetical protein